MDAPPEKVVPGELGTRAVQGKMVGFIRPPPDVRAIVDKTAAFVARMGDEVERKIAAAEQANVKFTFLRADDPYHSYYKHKVAEGRSGGGAPAAPAPAAAPAAPAAAAAAPAPAPAAPAPAAPAPAPERRSTVLPNPLARALRAFDPLAPPPRSECTVPTPAYAAPLEAETIRLTAQFTAAGGRPFLSALALREAANPAFSFLKPSHALFGFFTALVDAYARVLAPAAGTAARLAAAAGGGGGGAVLERVVARVESSQRDAEAKAQLQAGIDAARALVDWHDFVVVETVEFPEEEEEEETGGEGGGGGAGGGEAAAAAAGGGGGAEDMDMDDMDIGGGGGGGGGAAASAPSAAAAAAAAAAADDGERLNIRMDYVGGAAGAAAPAYHFVHPVTGKAVSLDAASEHLRIELMDPKWREERDRAQAKFATTNQLADGGDVAANLRRMAEKREDIFGQVAPAHQGAPAHHAGGGVAKKAKGGR
jgi:splicing factor 3A subunit 1